MPRPALLTFMLATFAFFAPLPDPGPCAEPAPPADERVAPGPGQPFRRAEGRREWRFPADHGQHAAYLLEWWYYTGTLATANGRRFGYQVTFFRKGLPVPAPNGATLPRASAWAARSLYLAHAAVSDVHGRRHVSDGRLGREALTMAGAAARRHEVWISSWRAAPLPDDPHGARLEVAGGHFSLDLTLRAVKPPVLHGEGGLDRKGVAAGQASWYYSLPRLATEGTLRWNGATYRVRGTSWMDHEFGTNQLGDRQAGWDWMALRLADGRDLMLYRLREVDGRTGALSGGTLIGPDGRATPLVLGTERASVAAMMTPTRWWTSPATGGRYPVGWQVEIPSAGLRLEVAAAFDAQEMTPGGAIPFPYWEGMVAVTGQAGPTHVSGEGYLELTGYAGALREAFR